MQIRKQPPNAPVQAVLMDFDGTISTLRYGWDRVMRRMMLEMIGTADGALEEAVDRYLDESTGIQTIHQMKWLAAQVEAHGGPSRDPWWYKDQYNARLMDQVERNIAGVVEGHSPREAYRIAGAERFLQAVTARGVPLYVASGTDDGDVRREAEVLGVAQYFAAIAGAPHRAEGCAKAAALQSLVDQSGLEGAAIAVIGDGKVEIMLGNEMGARTLGLASDEAARHGEDPVKRARLEKAGAHAIAGDYLELDAIMGFLGLEGE